MTHIMV